MTGTYCNICGKKFSAEDEYTGGFIHDGLTGSEDFDFCANCYEKLLNSLVPQCKFEPFQDVEEYDGQDESENDNSDYDFDGELN